MMWVNYALLAQFLALHLTARTIPTIIHAMKPKLDAREQVKRILDASFVKKPHIRLLQGEGPRLYVCSGGYITTALGCTPQEAFSVWWAMTKAHLWGRGDVPVRQP